jgi:hypothetical protein
MTIWLGAAGGWAAGSIAGTAMVVATNLVPLSMSRLRLLKEPAERFEAEQQAAGHLIGSRRPDHMLIHCQDVA